MTSLTKNLQLLTKKFFSRGLEDLPNLLRFKQLSSAIGGGAMVLVKQLKTAGYRWISRYEYVVHLLSRLEIDRYGFFGADADIQAIHELITNVSKIFISCFLVHFLKYNVFYALPFFQKLKKTGFMS